MFSICEMPFSPWQPTQSSAFSLPAAMSAASAGTLASAAQATNRTKRLRMFDISIRRFRHSGAMRSIEPGISRFPDAQLRI